MEKKIIELSCKTLLVDVSQYPLNFLVFPHRLAVNSYLGWTHQCCYCYARWYCPRDELRVKVNAPEICEKNFSLFLIILCLFHTIDFQLYLIFKRSYDLQSFDLFPVAKIFSNYCLQSFSLQASSVDRVITNT
jgi:hypothetical protein